MNRRAIVIAGGLTLLGVRAVFAQTSPRRVAVLLPGTQSGYRARYETFRAELKNLGYIEGRDVTFDVRWADDRAERFEALAKELVARRPEVILTGTSRGVAACQQATKTIPIVFATAASAIEQGFVASYARPGGNVTGVIIQPIEGKMVELAREALPQARRLAIVVYEPDPIHKIVLADFLEACAKLKFEPIIARVRRVEDLGVAFNEMLGQKPDALVLPSLAFTVSNERYLVERSVQAKLPLLSGRVETTLGGGLMSYGSSRNENFRRAAALVDKILRGAKPADLPVEQPERFEVVVNAKTMKAIGVELSPVTMMRARLVQ